MEGICALRHSPKDCLRLQARPWTSASPCTCSVSAPSPKFWWYISPKKQPVRPPPSVAESVSVEYSHTRTLYIVCFFSIIFSCVYIVLYIILTYLIVLFWLYIITCISFTYYTCIFRTLSHCITSSVSAVLQVLDTFVVWPIWCSGLPSNVHVYLVEYSKLFFQKQCFGTEFEGIAWNLLFYFDKDCLQINFQHKVFKAMFLNVPVSRSTKFEDVGKN